MLSFKETQAAQLLHEYYIETDLDSIDDQPVDYSKKYADQDSDEVYGSGKKRHLSTPSETLDTNKPDDELKVYCIEGTPLIISNASSMCDLRELVTTHMSDNETLKPHPGKKPCFQSIMYSNVTEEIDDSENIEDAKVEDKSVKLEKREYNEEVPEDLSFRNNENFSKVSSPLMFSRSSSVASLNSFEQHSIMDDRSSISIFSSLTSGIISPSDIPDSPGEVMSPFIHKNNKTEFLFPINDIEKSMDPILASLKDNAAEQFNSTFDIIPQDGVTLFEDEGDFSSVSNLSCLTFQTNSTRMSFAVFQSNEPFSNLEHKSTIQVSFSDAPHESDNKSCDKDNLSITMADCPKSTRNCDSSLFNFSITEPVELRLDEDVGTGDAICSLNLSVEENEQKVEEISYPESVNFDEEKCDPNSFDDDEKMAFLLESESKENSDDEDDALLEECIKSGMPSSSPSEATNSNRASNAHQSNQVLQLEETNQAHFSDASEDENDLIEHCIQLGMPQVPPVHKEEKVFEKCRIPPVGCYAPNHINVSSTNSANSAMQLQSPANHNIFPQSNFTKNQDEIEQTYSDEDDDLLDQCIKLGMPEPKSIAPNVTHNHASAVRSSNQAINPLQSSACSENDGSDDENDLIANCIQLGRPQNTNPNAMKSKNLNNYKIITGQSSTYSENDGSDDENDLLEHCIQLGRPHDTNPNAMKKSENLNNCKIVTVGQSSAYSENDGSDDENELLANCIQLGRPQNTSPNAMKSKNLNNSKVVTVGQTRSTISNMPTSKSRKPDLSNQQIKSSNRNVQNIKKPFKPISASNGSHPTCLGYSRNNPKYPANKGISECPNLQDFAPLGYRDNVPDGTSDVDEDDDDDEILSECIRAGRPSDKTTQKKQPLPAPTPSKSPHLKHLIQKKAPSDDRAMYFKKFATNNASQKQMYDPEFLRTEYISPSAVIDIDSMCVYRTEDTPLLSPTASISDLSTLSFSEDKMEHGNYLNNSRNSDCSSESEDDELLLQCIRSGMPGAKRAVA